MIDRAVAGRILVVDDVEANRVLLREMLELDGHQVTLAAGGADALIALRDEPDLMLLDVNMPEMDGLEVCRRVRADPAACALPIILVTALADRQHRLDGIGAGANDYLTKPIDRPDLLLRVRNALQLRKLHRELAAQYQRLEDLEKMRDSLVHMLVHDLRTPLTGISCYLQMSEARVSALGDVQLVKDFDEMGSAVVQLTEMISDMLDVSRLEANAMPLAPVACDLGPLAAEAVASLGRSPHATVTPCWPEEPVRATVDPDVMRRVIANLVGNALKFTPRGGEVRVEIEAGSAGAELRVVDRGPGIAPEFQERIFEKFGDANDGEKPRIRSSGLGLTFCKLAVEAHGGRIGVTSAVGEGSTFWLSLPA